MGNTDSEFHDNATAQAQQRMDNSQRPMQQQMNTRNVRIINQSQRKILARVAYQKSAITSSNIQQFNKTMTDKSKKFGAKVKADIPIPGIDSPEVEANYSGKNKKSNEMADTREYKMVVSRFNEEGWIPISGGRQRSFAMQGQIVYISVLDFITNKTVIHNWNTSGTHFVYDGNEFEEVTTNQSANSNQVVYAQQPTQVVYAQPSPRAQPTQVVYTQQPRQDVELQVGRTSPATTKTQEQNEDVLIDHNCCYYLFCCCIFKCIWDLLTCASCSSDTAKDENSKICKWMIGIAVVVIVVIIIIVIATAGN